MSTSPAETDELREMRNNVRRGVNALEICWSCEKLCEVSKTVLSGGHRVWLCGPCEQEALAHRGGAQLSN